MKIRFLILISLLLSSTILNAEDIKRKILVLHKKTDELQNSHVHRKLETILNYYGYFAEHVEINKRYFPKDIDKYEGFILWNYSTQIDDPLSLINYIEKFKNKKNIIIGSIPYFDKNKKNHLKHINTVLKRSFDFSLGESYSDETSLIKQFYNKKYFNFEKKVSFLTNVAYSKVDIHNKSFDVIFKEKYKNETSNSAFFAPWGFYAQADSVFYDSKKFGGHRWLMDPFKLVQKVYKTNYPIPETTTKEGKRISYIHIDGDGILSKSFNQKYTIENGYDFLSKIPIKTGISFIAVELDKNGPIFNNPMLKRVKDFKPELFNENAKKLLELPFVEPASHTYTHPFNWRKGMVAYSVNKNAKKVLYENEIPAFQEPDRQVNLKYEIHDSIEYIQKLIPSKKVETLYWSGDCYPSIRDLKYIEDHNILAFNGGDSRFDLAFNSYAYVMPVSLYTKGVKQIYSSNSNENTYTEDWTENYWRFKKVITTFENTGYPKRIKPANVYYHFYSFAKKGSYNALKTVYDYLLNNDFEYIYPSEYIKIAKNFHDIKIKQLSKNSFEISNIKELKEFRLEGKRKVSSKDLKNLYYDKKLNVTYFRIKNNINKTKVRID